ncbi:MAG: hypothetical protein ABS85_12020 [Sphingobacteriales bacterium SCN 48-20]|mgnify:CR=1 FL=1|uniref:SusD/RagB family nutrient-binding outer membrane lipoprotein n=1 Tax=Terrimonas ferruginea TaxID=249 RepID=UPI00086E1C48|nr:SusD/RagB family nutrient-binding outer membrane lipoprotein [Terrimonas ferruginea]MBN8782097.1 SusD/RagB family nutrient-binding outer membrane lipoprotein [Terrimonas ferruginea]ODT91645.1 MAG: hypothetical protein ABS85_12020 [Sphingobacteriales bacterium SCN 48-20]OJW42643.1 MAG: hypothetical protein BGO56_11325 [Sphingobacteriales bacterium 48-107]
MKKNTILLLAVAMTGILPGCKKFVEKGDVNTNPNRPPFVTLNTLLPAVETATAANHTNVAYITSMFSQQMAAYTSGPINDDQHRDVRISAAYAGIYQNGLTNAKILLDLAREQGSPHYRAIARILFVTNLALATDTWGEIPLTEAFNAPAQLYPAYESQQSIYDFMHKYLDSAITEIGQTNPATVRPGVDDLIYGGTMASWTQTAWFLKARLYMHTTKKGVAAATSNALAALGNAFTSSSKPYQVVYSDRNNNPWFIQVSGRISGSQVFTIGPSKRFVDALTGITYPGLFDPRIDTLIFKSGTGVYTGIPNGAGNVSNNVNLTDVTFYGRRVAPLLMGSYFEQKLMEAEALFLANGGTQTSTGSTPAAYAAYMEGIVANLRYLGYDTLLTTPNGIKGKTYVNLPQVRSSAAALRLELIMREKHVALFLNPEAWTDMRRYDYSTTLYPGVALPLNQDAGMGGQFIRRALYPLDEINRNPNAQAALKTLTTKVWWDE